MGGTSYLPAANLTQPSNTPSPASTSSTGNGGGDYFTAAASIINQLFSGNGAWGAWGAAGAVSEEYVFVSPLAEKAAQGLGNLTPQQQKAVSEQLDQYALSLSTQLDPNQIKLDLQEQLEQEGYDQETIEAVLEDMFHGKSGSSGLESGLSVQNPQTGLNPAESLQSSLINGYKNTLVGIYTGELTQEQAKAKIKDFSSAASKKIETYKNELQELAQEKAEYKKGELDQKAASHEADGEIARSPDPDQEGSVVSSIFSNGTSLA